MCIRDRDMLYEQDRRDQQQIGQNEAPQSFAEQQSRGQYAVVDVEDRHESQRHDDEADVPFERYGRVVAVREQERGAEQQPPCDRVNDDLEYFLFGQTGYFHDCSM